MSTPTQTILSELLNVEQRERERECGTAIAISLPLLLLLSCERPLSRVSLLPPSSLSFEQVVKMMMIVVMVFGVCWLPYQGRDSTDI